VGIHAPELTQNFVEGLGTPLSNDSSSSYLRNILIFSSSKNSSFRTFDCAVLRSPWRSTKTAHSSAFSAGVSDWGSLGWQLLEGM